MAGMVYPGYASYLQMYQRQTNSYCGSNYPFSPYDKKYKTSETSLTPQNDSLPTNYDNSTNNIEPTSHISNVTVDEANLAEPQALNHHHKSPLVASTASLNSSPSTASTVTVSSSPVANRSHKSPPDPPQDVSDPENKSEEITSAHYLSANCVILTYFTGDLASAIEDHFTRALSQSSKDTKDSWPMSQRNLPASFWNSHYQYAPHSAGYLSHDVFYPDYTAELHSLSQAESWPYNFGTHHRAVSDFPYMPASHRYPHNYSSLLMGRSRLHQCMMPKSEPWSSHSTSRFQADAALESAASYTHHFQAVQAGLEGSSTTQEHSKDLYWF